MILSERIQCWQIGLHVIRVGLNRETTGSRKISDEFNEVADFDVNKTLYVSLSPRHFFPRGQPQKNSPKTLLLLFSLMTFGVSHFFWAKIK